MRTKLLLIIALISTFGVLSQNPGDYRSKGAGPVAWNLASSWEVYNGTNWVDATNYPGQISGAFDVEIVSGHTVTIPTSANFNALMPFQFGNLTVNGEINIALNQNVYINATSTIVTQNVGTINFLGNADLHFPENMSLSVHPGGLIPAENNNTCNASKRIYIGTVLFSTCNGNGPGDPVSFFELMQSNGTLLSIITAAFADCNASVFNVSLVPSYVGVAGNNTTFSWSIKQPNNIVINSTNNPLVLDLNQYGVYEINLTYITTISGQPFSHTRKVTYDNKLLVWNGTSWTNNEVPTLESRAIIAANYSGASFSSCFLKINNDATLTIHPNNYVEVEGSIDNQGAIVIESGGSLVQNDDASTFSGNSITVKRTSRPMKRNDYVYWGSPVQENVIEQIPTLFDKKFRWQAGANANWFDLTTTTPSPGNGFITRYRNPDPTIVAPTPITFTFTGKPNNGVVTAPVSFVDNVATNYSNYNLLANPYPSGIDAAKFIEANNNVLSGTIHFWTSVTLYSGTGEYNVMDYATWNKSGSNAPDSTTDNEDLDPRGTIASGQGIFVQAKANGTALFNNAMRKKDENNQFFRTANPLKSNQHISTQRQRNRIWLTLSNNKGAFRNMMVGYIEGATNGFEDAFDGISFTSNNIDFYSVLEDKNLAIQGRALPFKEDDVVAIGFKTNEAGNYSIQINGQDGFFEKGFPVYLHDKTNNTYHNLRNGAFSFNTTVGSFNNRFELLYDIEKATYSGDIIENEVLTYGSEKSIYIFSKELKIKKVQVYDILGKLLFSNTSLDTNEFTTPLQTKSKSFLIIKTVLENNTTDTQKIILH